MSRDSIGIAIERNFGVSLLITISYLPSASDAGSKTFLQQILPVLKWGFHLTQIDNMMQYNTRCYFNFR